MFYFIYYILLLYSELVVTLANLKDLSEYEQLKLLASVSKNVSKH